ncbi:hypothetical protein [Mangrovivirga cuniculi]|nr:hypothetical protein [Mangrovivirga cuniculi]
MKILTTITTAFIFVYFLMPCDIMAQEEMQPKKLENATWKEVVFVDFKPGKMGRALEIINDYFRKAADMSATSFPETMIELKTGPWDMMVVWSMKDGLDEMNWEVSPDNIKWRKAMEKIAKDEGASAKAIWEEYQSLIARSSMQLGMSRSN